LGETKVEDAVAHVGTKINGWSVASNTGDRAFSNGNWLARATAAKAGIYGNDAVEAMYPLTATLPGGEVIDGSKHNYTLTFAAGQFPPVNAFGPSRCTTRKPQFLIKNPIDRYLISAPMLPGLKKNPGRSLTLYIQNDAQSADKKPNWICPDPRRHCCN
jgi:hypothetical protein